MSPGSATDHPRRSPPWAGPLLALVSFALASAAAWGIYERWRGSDARSLQAAQVDHITSFGDLVPGVEARLLAFPATERFEDVPRFSVLLNSRGVRERDFEVEPSRLRIVAVGESSTFGTGLEIGQRFTELLQGSLDAAHPGCCEVLNAGRMGMTTPTAVGFVMGQVATWKPRVLIYDSMANDLADPDHPGRIDLSPERVLAYEARLRELTAFCAEQGIAVVFWANTIARTDDPLSGFRAAMERVAADSASGYVDLGALYRSRPASAEEMKAFLAEANWTQWFDVVGPGRLPLHRVALHVDWVHPNRFGSARLAAGLLPLVEQAAGLRP